MAKDNNTIETNEIETNENTNEESVKQDNKEEASKKEDSKKENKKEVSKDETSKQANKKEASQPASKKEVSKKGGKKSSKKQQEEELKKLTPAERKAIKKQKKREQYQKEKAQRKVERYQSSSQKFYNHHKVFSIVCAVILVVAICTGAAYFFNTGFFRGDSYKFFSYSKYVTVADHDKQTYKKADLKVTDKEVQEEIDSRLSSAEQKKLTKSFIKKVTDGECTTEKEYRAAIREMLEDNNKVTAGQTLLTEITTDSKVNKYPKKQYKAAKEDVNSQYETMASQYSMDLDSLIAAMGMDEDTFNQQVKSSAKQSVKQKLVIHAIAKEAGISLSGSEYKECLAAYKIETGLSDSEFESQAGSSYEDYAKENNFKEYFLQEKVEKYLVDQATGK